MTGSDRPRLYLSPPNITESEVEAVTAALRSGWVAPLGPEVDAFEADVATFCGRRYAVALSSGTAALHLGLLALGVGPGDEVVVPTMTFGATAFAVTYVGASPVFLDIEPDSWNLDPTVLDEFLSRRAALDLLPAAVVAVDVFGRTCNYDRIMAACAEYRVPVLGDAAEALGAQHGAHSAGAFGESAVFSFNGNKIMTTSGGGMLVTDDEETASKVRFWATQSREPFPWYEHKEVGFNYRMSNILAALGRAQLQRLPTMIERRREIRDRYDSILGPMAGVSVVGDPPWGQSNAWLTTVRFESTLHPDAPRRVREALEVANIESRPVWKPMHRQPVFAGAQSYLTGMADEIFADGLCLPSGAAMSDPDVARVSEIVTTELTG
jgi:dTDP-4-amino-4,6-dideoxygalactose transaminase